MLLNDKDFKTLNNVKNELIQIKINYTAFDLETYLYKVYFNLDWCLANFVYTDKKTQISHNIAVNSEDFNIKDFNKQIRQFGFELI